MERTKPITDLVNQQYPSGITLLSEGKTSGVLFFLCKGEVEVKKAGIPICKVSKPGAVFGEISVLLDKPHTATVTTTKPSSFVVAHNAQLFFRNNPDAGYYIAQLLAARLLDLNESFIGLQADVMKKSSAQLSSKKLLNALKSAHTCPATIPAKPTKKGKRSSS